VVPISANQELELSSDAVVMRQQELVSVLACMREELDDHRLAINENTQETSSAYEFLNEISRRMDKMSERLDELTLLIKGQPSKAFDIKPLSSREKDVFHAIYVLTETQPFASYEQIARKAVLAKEQVVGVITTMMHKGVPLQKKLDGSVAFVKLDPAFRELQAKKNVIGLNSLLTSWLA